MRNTFIDHLLEKAKLDKRIMLITGDLGYGVVDRFASELPNQYLNMGINEQSMMGAAAGLASSGLKPFVYSIGNFPTFRCMEQIRNDVCYMDLDVTIVAIGAGLAYGTAGYSHHLIEDLSALSTFRNLNIYSPADVTETKISLDLILNQSGPKYIRLGKGGEGNLVADFDLGVKGVSIRHGDPNFAIISTGNILTESIKLQQLLRESNPTLISVYDYSSLTFLLKGMEFRKLISMEEHILRGGFGSSILENIENTETKIIRIGIDKVESKYSGDQHHLRAKYRIDAQSAFDKISQGSFL